MFSYGTFFQNISGHDPTFLKKFLNKKRLQNKSPDMIIESESFEVTKQDDEETNPFKELIVKDNDSKELSKDTFIPVELVNEEPFPRSVLELRIKVTRQSEE